MNVFNLIKERVPILDVINEHTVLKKIGHYWKGQCPFHSERTASFTVSPHRQMFYCFGCQAGGDVISFLSKIENCTQIEAAKQLAERYGIELPDTFTHETITLDEKKRYFALCELFAQWSHTQLLKSPHALSYLHERNISKKSIEAFKLGYFPEGEKVLKDLIKEAAHHNFLLEDLFQAGIINEGKNAYSPFEGRILFPIKDHIGHYCGFGGRIFKPTDQRSKYYNSKENSFFQKGTLLFGFDSAKKEMQKTNSAFLVEGYTDCIALVQHGYPNTVATLGTACTPEHLKALSHQIHTLYVLYDNDDAGHKATLRLAQLCWQFNLEIKVIVLPESKDPAAFFETHTDLTPFIEKATDVLDFFLVSLGKEYASKPLTLKLQATRSFLEIIKKLDDPLKKEILLQRASTTFSLPLGSLRQELSSFSTSPLEKEPQHEPKTVLPELSSLEKNFISAILNDSMLLENPRVKDLVEYLPEPFCTIMEKIPQFEATSEKEQRFASFFDALNEQERMLLNQLLFTQEEESYDLEQLFLLLEKKYWKKIVSFTKIKLSQAQEENDSERIRALVESFLELKKRLLHKGLI
jgi:DNA primase